LFVSIGVQEEAPMRIRGGQGVCPNDVEECTLRRTGGVPKWCTLVQDIVI